jgi:hypothetical protein
LSVGWEVREFETKIANSSTFSRVTWVCQPITMFSGTSWVYCCLQLMSFVNKQSPSRLATDIVEIHVTLWIIPDIQKKAQADLLVLVLCVRNYKSFVHCTGTSVSLSECTLLECWISSCATPWSIFLLDKIIGHSANKVTTHFMEPEDSLPRVGFEVLVAVDMKSSILWNITPWGSSEVKRCFGGTCRLHLQVRE